MSTVRTKIKNRCMDDHAPSFGAEIKRRRLALGLTQEWLANRVGMDRPHLSKIENGKIGAPVEPLRSALLSALGDAERERGIGAEERRAAVDYARSVAEAVGPDYDALADPALARLLEAMSTLSSEGREDLMDYVDLLLARETRRRGRSLTQSSRERG